MAVKPVIDLISKIFGKKALSKTIGTRTNVITLPDADVKRVIKNDLDIAKASDAQLEVFKDRVEKLIPDIPKMNDQELLTLKGNLQRYYDRMYPPKAEVFDFQTKARVPKEGIEQLETQLGIPSDVDPNSPLGQIMTKTKQIEKQGKDLAKEFGMEDVLRQGLKGLDDTSKTTDELYEQTRKAIEEPTEAEKAFRAKERSRIGQVFDETAQAQSSYIKMQNEGLVRATAREIMERDIKSGKLQIPKEEMQVITEYSSVNDPIDIWRKYYGEDALEQLDSMVPDFYNMRTSREAADAATKKFTFEPKLDRPVGSFDPDKPPEFADGGRVGLEIGGVSQRAIPLPKTLPPNMTLEEYTERELNRPPAIAPVGTVTSPRPGTIGYMGPSELELSPSIPKLSEVDRLANQYIQNTTGRFIDENKNGIDDRLEGFNQGGRVHAAGGLMKGMIDWLVKNRNFAKELLDRVSKQKNGEKLIKELYEAETKKTGPSPVTMGEAPKTDLKKVRDKAETDKKITAELAKDKQIPVKDQTEQKTKTIKTILNEDQLRALGRKEGIPEEDVEKFLSGELGLLKRGQARGMVQRDKEGNIVIKDKYSKKYDPLRENPVFKDETIIPEDVMTVPEPFKGKYQQEFLAHDALYGRRSGDNKVDAEAIAETVADMQGKVYDDLGYSERMDLYDKAYGYLSLLDRTQGAMKEASDLQKSGRQLNAGGGLAYLMGL